MNGRRAFFRFRVTMPLVAVVAAWLAVISGLAFVLAFDFRLRDAGRGDLVQLELDATIYVVAIVSAMVVGSSLGLRRPRHPVGWLFFALAITITISGVSEAIYTWETQVEPGSLPGAGIMAVLEDAIFVPLLAILGLILLLTPSGRPPEGRIWRATLWAIALGGAITYAWILLRPYRGPLAETGALDNPIALPDAQAFLTPVGTTALWTMHVGVLLGAASLPLRLRHADAGARRQLRILGLPAIAFGALVVLAAGIAVFTEREDLLAVVAGIFLMMIPLAVAVAIERDRLYDVERLVSRGLLWLLLTAIVVGCYAVVVVLVGEFVGNLQRDSQIPAVIATLAAVSVLGPARQWLQNGLDRRFNQRRFEAIAAIRRYLREPTLDLSIEDALRQALTDDSLSVSFWIDDRDCWVDARGHAQDPGRDAELVHRHALPVCAIDYDASRVRPETARAVFREAAAELENARLRAAISLQLVEVRESRARIVAAQTAERHRIERNLHDGAQQRLLAIALNLRAAEVSQDQARGQAAMRDAVDQIRQAVHELRELANGLAPTILADAGLPAALDDLAARTPVPVRMQVSPDRFPLQVEETAWFIACEAIANAVKHAQPGTISLHTERQDGCLLVMIADDGVGQANPDGLGLRGIADRAEAIGGHLVVRDHPVRGTVVTAVLPCGS